MTLLLELFNLMVIKIQNPLAFEVSVSIDPISSPIGFQNPTCNFKLMQYNLV
uniref:Uncharacterized protein n=1 Tax=Rhizophagus irregularis (strain DAOM 181602 / DAOM 197198 / MUCL 43194) TaxID=747089 RepID=U9TAE9_RHIID